MAYPTTLDSFTTHANGDVIDPAFDNAQQVAISALETKVGVDSSAVTTTLDYKLKNVASVNPGHKHTLSSSGFSDVDMTGLVDGNLMQYSTGAGNKWIPATTSAPDASTTVKGVTKMSVAPATGANNVVISTTSGLGRMNSDCASYTGASQTGQPDATNTGGPTTTGSYSQALTTVANNSWSIANIIGTSGAVMTAGANTAILFNLEVTAFGNGLIHSGTNLTPAGSNPLAVTSSSQTFYSCIASFSPAGGGGGTTYRRKALLGVGQ